MADVDTAEVDRIMDVLKKSPCQRTGCTSTEQPILTKYVLDIIRKKQNVKQSRCINCKNAQCMKGCPVCYQYSRLH